MMVGINFSISKEIMKRQKLRIEVNSQEKESTDG